MKQQRLVDLLSVLFVMCFLVPILPAEAQIRCPRRVLITLQGINTSFDTQNATFGTILSRVSSLYSEVVPFSYRLDGLSYQEEDTFQFLSESVAALTQTVRQQTAICPSVSIDLVGHSLGGMVAFTFLGSHELEPESQPIKHLLTLDSPVNGSSLSTVRRAGDLLNIDFAGSDVAKTLISIDHDVKVGFNIDKASRFRGRAVIRTFGSHDDWVVPYEDSVIPGFEVELSLGNARPFDPGDLRCFTSVILAAACAGHSQILESTEAIDQIASILSWQPPIQLSFTEGTTSAISSLVSLDGTWHLAWLAFRSVPVPGGSGTSDRRSVYKHRLANGQWSQETVLPSCKFQSPKLVSHPDGSVWIFSGNLGECAYRVASGQPPRQVSTLAQGLPTVYSYVWSAVFDREGNLHILSSSPQTTVGGDLTYAVRSVSGIWSRPEVWARDFVRSETKLFLDAQGTMHALYILDNYASSLSAALYRVKRVGTSDWSKPIVLADVGKQGEIIDGIDLVSVGMSTCGLIRSFGPGRLMSARFTCSTNLTDWTPAELLPESFRPTDSNTILVEPDRTVKVVGAIGQGQGGGNTRLAMAIRLPDGKWSSSALELSDMGKAVFFPVISATLDGALNIAYSASYDDPEHMEVFFVKNG